MCFWFGTSVPPGETLGPFVDVNSVERGTKDVIHSRNGATGPELPADADSPTVGSRVRVVRSHHGGLLCMHTGLVLDEMVVGPFIPQACLSCPRRDVQVAYGL